MPSPKWSFALPRRIQHNAVENWHELKNLWHNKHQERHTEFQTFLWYFKEILFCVLIALLLTYVDKFQHFFSALAILVKSNACTVKKTFLIFFSNGLMVLWLCFVFWHKPKRLHWDRYRRIIFGNRRREGYQAYFRGGGSMWRLCVVSGLPFLLACTALALSLMRNNRLGDPHANRTFLQNFMAGHPFLVIVVVSLLYWLLGAVLRPRTSDHTSLQTRWRILAQNMGIFTGIITVLFVMLAFYREDRIIANYLVWLFLMFFPALGCAFMLHAFSQCLCKELASGPKRPAEKGKFGQTYDFLVWTSYITGIVLFLLVNNRNVTVQENFSLAIFPVAMLMFVFICYYQSLDWLLYNMTLGRFYLLSGLVLVLLGVFSQTDHYALKFKGSNTARGIDRIPVQQFFLTWAKDRFESDPSDTLVYLVAAEGGGSRAGAWTSAVLTELDRSSQGYFRRHCFAISSVSGGSVGTLSTLALWDPALMTKDHKAPWPDSISRPYIKRVFGRNYISTALAGIFFYDFFQQIPGLHYLYGGNSRTDRHQDEENNAIYLGLKENVYGSDPAVSIPSTYVQKMGFLDLYYSDHTGIKTGLPLFFPNTCRVEDGRRGVVSPVEMDIDPAKNIFPAAFDVLSLKGEQGSLGLGEATSMSELFPYVNSTILTGKNGSFMDGGVFDNLGLTTLYEIYNALKYTREYPDTAVLRQIMPDPVKRQAFEAYVGKLKFSLLTIYWLNNHAGDQVKSYNDGHTHQLVSPLKGLLGTPFGGHADHIYHTVMKEMSVNRYHDLITEFYFRKIGETGAFPFPKPEDDEIVMSRWLSAPELNTIIDSAGTRVRANMHIFPLRRGPGKEE